MDVYYEAHGRFFGELKRNYQIIESSIYRSTMYSLIELGVGVLLDNILLYLHQFYGNTYRTNWNAI